MKNLFFKLHRGGNFIAFITIFYYTFHSPVYRKDQDLNMYNHHRLMFTLLTIIFNFSCTLVSVTIIIVSEIIFCKNFKFFALEKRIIICSKPIYHRVNICRNRMSIPIELYAYLKTVVHTPDVSSFNSASVLTFQVK